MRSITRSRMPLLWLLLTLLSFPSLAQDTETKQKRTKLTRVKGIVLDKETKEPLPFVNIAFVGTSVGTTTDFDGKYEIETQWGSESIEVSYLGYVSQQAKVNLEERNVIDIELESESLKLDEVVVKAKKKRYKKKNNPAVALMRKVIANKGNNSLGSHDFYELDKYEKVELDINNITDKFKARKAFKKFQFIFDFVDTSDINGKPYLPIFLQEISSKIYYSKEASQTREVRDGIQATKLEGYLDEKSLTTIMDYLYNEVDIYKGNVILMGNQFTSPLSAIAPDFYRFYIIDTVEYNGNKAVDMAFIPKVKGNFGFNGNMLIALDDTYQVLKVDMGVVDDINLNFVQDLVVEQEFKKGPDGKYLLAKDKIIVDYNLTKKGIGFFGKKTVYYNNHIFDKGQEPSFYAGAENIIEKPDAWKVTDDHWKDKRPENLTLREEGVYHMIDTLQQVPAFKRALNIVSFLTTGYTPIGKFDLGPINSFYSGNSVEGFRLRVGGRTNVNFHPRLQIDSYVAYGFKDKEVKGALALLYSFRENFEDNPKHFVRFGFNRETRFPGLELEFVNEDNVFLSIRRGEANRMLLFDSFRGEYFKENNSNLTTTLTVERLKQTPVGSLTFDFTGDNGEPTSLDAIRTTEFGANFRFAPNANYFQGKVNRYPIFNKHPIFQVSYLGAYKNLLGSSHGYHKVRLGIFKRFYLSVLGFTNMELEAGKIFGKEIPYVLLHIPRANQSYTLQRRSFNMMNFLEFASDEYVKLNFRHYFNGFFFNRIPLLKKLKLREVITFKSIYGGLSDDNDPTKNPQLIQYTTTEDGTQETFSLRDKPYMEASVGILNIFKVLRVDFIKRLTYLDNPNIPSLWGVKGLGIRGRIYVEF